MAKSFFPSISLPARLGCWIAVFFFLTSVAIMGYAKASILVWVLPLCLAAVFLANIHSACFLGTFFFLLPLLGFLSFRYEIPAMPVLLPFFWIGFATWCRKGSSGDQKLEFPFPVWLCAVGLLGSAAYGGFSFLGNGLNLNAVVASPPWGPIYLKNALGWVMFNLSLSLAGVFLFSWLTAEQDNFSKTFPFLLAALPIAVAVGLFQFFYFKVLDGPAPFKNNAVLQFNATLSDPNTLGLMCALVLPLWFAFTMNKDRHWFVKIAGVELILLLALASSRSAYLLVGVATLILSIRYLLGPRRELGRPLRIFLSFAVGLFILQMIFFPSRFHRLVGQAVELLQQKKSLTLVLGDRLHLWKSGWVTFEHNKVVGTGFGTYLVRMPAYASEIQLTNDNSGNMYLHVAAEQGWVGFTVFILLLVSYLSLALEGGFHRTPWENAAAFAALIGLSVAFVFGAHLLSFEINLLFWCLLAVIQETHKKRISGLI